MNENDVGLSDAEILEMAFTQFGIVAEDHEITGFARALLARATPAVQPIAQTASDELHQRVQDAIASALGDAYDCTRVWDAWHVGTMTEDDFSLITDDSDRLAELADAAISALAAPAAPEPSEHAKRIAELDEKISELSDDSFVEHARDYTNSRMLELLIELRSALALKRPAPAQQPSDTAIHNEVIEALKFYAEGHHFDKHDPDAWDTVSGEPANFQEDEHNTATVEDGSIAKLALEKLALEKLALRPAAQEAAREQSVDTARDALDWAVHKWNEEVVNRPLINIHRRTLDSTWRQMIRHFGGDDRALVGPTHDELLAGKDAT